MKTSGFKLLLIAVSVIAFSGFTAPGAYAQRGGHAGGRGSRGGGFSRPAPGIGRFNGPGVYRPVYRPGYRGYYTPYYPYYNFYRPFLGLSISVLPYGYYPFYFGPYQYYYCDGLFYTQYDNAYEVVTPPIGAQMPRISSNAQEVVINGQTYYVYKGVYYSPVKNAKGKTVYVVAGKDGVLNTDSNSGNALQIGDIVDQLPASCIEVTIKDEKYYLSADGVYYEQVVNEGKTAYRVAGLSNYK